MVMMSPDGRYVVTGGQRSSKAYIIDSHTLKLVKVIPVGLFPEHLAFLADGRYYYQGNPKADSISVIDMQSLSVIKTIEGLKEPLKSPSRLTAPKPMSAITALTSLGVIDVTRHEVIKKNPDRPDAGHHALEPTKYLNEIHGIFNATPSADGRYLYAADGDLGVVGVIDTREDKVIKVIRVGRDPWRLYMSHDGRYGITANNGDETISIIDTTKNDVVRRSRARRGYDRHQFSPAASWVIGLDHRLPL
jgi:YVTN family beta-propeller protein